MDWMETEDTQEAENLAHFHSRRGQLVPGQGRVSNGLSVTPEQPPETAADKKQGAG